MPADVTLLTVINSFFLLLITIIGAYNAYQARKNASASQSDRTETKQIAQDTQVIAQATHDVAQKTEVNANSMREALVKATGAASRAEGVIEGTAVGLKQAADDRAKE